MQVLTCEYLPSSFFPHLTITTKLYLKIVHCRVLPIRYQISTLLYVSCMFNLYSALVLRVWLVPLVVAGGVWLGQRQRRCGDPVCVFPAANSAM